MSSTRFEDLLERTMGLNAASIGASAVRRAVNARIRACDLESDDAYWTLLQRSREELQELIDAVIVPETWFFRDPQAFAAMALMATTQAGKGASFRPLRLLSLPCSTGEEPYTMAMALLDAGLPASGFRIEAVDICARSLAQARLGVYGRNSFRGGNLAFRHRHFEAVERGYRISDAVRASVQFAFGNILDADFLAGAASYDFIFCRNLLIYFDGPTQNRAIGVLKRLLGPQGALFVGHSEAGLMFCNGFASAKIPMAFAFHAAPLPPSSPMAEPVVGKPSVKHKMHAARPAPVRSPRPGALAREAVPVAARPSIDELRQIADSGRLEEAAQGCKSHIREHGPSSDALLLLALINDASGDFVAAANYYRKALYLDPGNSEALGHLALLLRKRGDHDGARLLDERMRRNLGRRVG
jgi:chemotaxis protein methyltransferase WspC